MYFLTFFFVVLFCGMIANAAPYEMGSGQPIRIIVRADVFDLDVDVVEVDKCDYDTNEACQMIIKEVVEE